jgi:hypothetical protein
LHGGGGGSGGMVGNDIMLFDQGLLFVPMRTSNILKERGEILIFIA